VKVKTYENKYLAAPVDSLSKFSGSLSRSLAIHTPEGERREQREKGGLGVAFRQIHLRPSTALRFDRCVPHAKEQYYCPRGAQIF
jgi:hypothetical protein